jgi:putative ABC transport system permease protein
MRFRIRRRYVPPKAAPSLRNAHRRAVVAFDPIINHAVMSIAAIRAPRIGLAVLVVSFVVLGTLLGRQITARAPAEGPTVELVVRGPVTTGQEEQIGRLIDGVDEVYGQVEAVTRGITVTADPGAGPFATTTLRAGRYPLGPGEVAVTPRTASRLGLGIGSTIKGPSLTVTGLVTGREDSGLQAYAPQTTVTALRGNDRLDDIEVRVRPGVDPEGVRKQIETLLGPKARIGTTRPGSS